MFQNKTMVKVMFWRLSLSKKLSICDGRKYYLTKLISFLIPWERDFFYAIFFFLVLLVVVDVCLTTNAQVNKDMWANTVFEKDFAEKTNICMFLPFPLPLLLLFLHASLLLSANTLHVSLSHFTICSSPAQTMHVSISQYWSLSTSTPISLHLSTINFSVLHWSMMSICPPTTLSVLHLFGSHSGGRKAPHEEPDSIFPCEWNVSEWNLLGSI